MCQTGRREQVTSNLHLPLFLILLHLNNFPPSLSKTCAALISPWTISLLFILPLLSRARQAHTQKDAPVNNCDSWLQGRKAFRHVTHFNNGEHRAWSPGLHRCKLIKTEVKGSNDYHRLKCCVLLTFYVSTW